MGQGRIKSIPHGGENQNLANIASAKYYILRAFSESLKQFSLKQTSVVLCRDMNIEFQMTQYYINRQCSTEKNYHLKV